MKSWTVKAHFDHRGATLILSRMEAPDEEGAKVKAGQAIREEMSEGVLRNVTRWEVVLEEQGGTKQ
jgi:hypothetical protein